MRVLLVEDEATIAITLKDDLTDAVHWAVKEGIADRDRVCIYGWSYGGYASLMSAVNPFSRPLKIFEL